MKKFVYFLADAPNYPNEIYANSPAEVKKLILESVPDESQILRIIDASNLQPAPQKQATVKQVQQIQSSAYEDIDPNDFNNANDFFNSVMNAAISKEASKSVAEKPVIDEQPQPMIVENNTKVAPIKKEVESARFFEEAGIQFKLENGRLFKRSWVNVSDDDMPQFRIKVRKTGKLADEDKFVLEKLEWVEIKS